MDAYHHIVHHSDCVLPLMWYLWFMGIQITWSPARSNLLYVAFPCLTFQWLMQGQCLCVNLQTPLTQAPLSCCHAHVLTLLARCWGAGTFCGQCVINVFDSTLNLDHLKSLIALWVTRAHGVLCDTKLLSSGLSLCCFLPVFKHLFLMLRHFLYWSLHECIPHKAAS